MLNVYKQEKKILFTIFDEKAPKKSSLANFINIILTNLKSSREYTENFEQYQQIIAWFASLGPDARFYLLKIKTLKWICLFVQEKYFKVDEEYSEEEFRLPCYENYTPEIGIAPEDNARVSNLEKWYQEKEQERVWSGVGRYNHICEALSYLIWACDINGKCPTSFEGEAFILPEDEIKYC